MRTIEGRPPALDSLPAGCAFAERCEFTTALCSSKRPELLLIDEPTRHRTACLRVQEEGAAAPATTVTEEG